MHLHPDPKYSREKIDTSIESGCLRMDGAIQGFGGCPMASDSLVAVSYTHLTLPTKA